MTDVNKYLVSCSAEPKRGVAHWYVWAENLEQALDFAGKTIVEREMSYLSGKQIAYSEIVRSRFEYTSSTCIFVYDSKDRLWFTVQRLLTSAPKPGDTEFICYLEDRSIVDDFEYRGGYIIYESAE